MSRILTLQRQARELGRLRTGVVDTSGSKPRPKRSDTWVITSHSQDYIEAAAEEWGGTPEKWQPQGNGAEQWRVITTSSAVDAILPPGDPLSQAYEMWNRGGCARRCDGMTESLTDSPCICRADHGDDFYEQKVGTVCSMTTRLNVMLPAMPDIGVWRAETHSYYAANELAGHVDTIRGLVGPQALIPVRLRIEQRTRIAGGQTKHFPVIALELRGITAGQVLGGGRDLLQIGSNSGPAGAIEAAPVPDYVSAARAAFSIAEWREVWQRAKEAGHLTDALKAELTPIGEALSQQAQAAAPPTAGTGRDPDDVWADIVRKAPEGWDLPKLDDDFAAWSKGTIASEATAEQLEGYLTDLSNGWRS